jgi:hypothetical protein
MPHPDNFVFSFWATIRAWDSFDRAVFARALDDAPQIDASVFYREAAGFVLVHGTRDMGQGPAANMSQGAGAVMSDLWTAIDVAGGPGESAIERMEVSR